MSTEPQKQGAEQGPGGVVEAAAPDKLQEIPARSWGAVVRRTASEFMDDELPDKAAALTYYGVLSIFPTLLMLVSVLGAVGENATRQVLDEVKGLTPGPAREILTSSLEDLQSSGGSSGLVAVISLLGALWAASGYVGAFIRTSNGVYDLPEGRPIWKVTPLRVGLTLALLVLLACSLLIVVFTGSLARWAGDAIGVGDEALTVWAFAKWPVLALLVVLMLALLFWASPNAKVKGFRWLSLGSVIALGLWLLFSAGFAFYLANFASYNKTYGAMAGVAIFLLWMWLTNLAILLGLEFDAELARQRAIEGGLPEDEEPYVVPRDTRAWTPGQRRRRRGVGPAGRAGEGADEAAAQEAETARVAGTEKPDGR